jgi:two-component system sensor histidine kinase KdpD
LLNYYFSPPIHQWTIAQRDNVIALVAFVLTAAAVSWVVDLAARRTTQAARASAESLTLATAAGSVLRGETAVPELLARLREALSLDSVTLLEHGVDRAEEWKLVEFVGGTAIRSPADGDACASGNDRAVLVVRGRVPRPEDQRLLTVFAVQAAIALEHQRLAAAAEAVKPLEEADRMRAALLAAVSHDLRSPLASATAAIDSLGNKDVPWTAEQRAELLATARESLDRLTRLVENLLDMSRVQADALPVMLEPTRLDEVIPLVLDALGKPAADVKVDLPDNLPEVQADPALLERVVANLLANALRFSGPETPPRLSASTHGNWVELRVIDFGPGVPHTDWERIFTPFQRLGDTDNTTGVGLGLALARGLTEAMGGGILPEETPGGGLTMIVQLPVRDHPARGTAPTEMALS